MKINLYKLLEVEEKEEFKIEGCDYDYRFRVYNNRIQHFDKELKLWEYSTLTVNALAASEFIKLPKKKEFTDEELCILRNIDKKYKWIARDKVDRDEYDNYGNLNIYLGKPNKSTVSWLPSDEYCEFHAYNHLFQSIKWEDEEPVYIDDYVDRK